MTEEELNEVTRLWLEETKMTEEELNEVTRLWLELERAGVLARTCYNMTDTVSKLPSAQRKEGVWIWDDKGVHCSECLYHADGNATMEIMLGEYHFCPKCGVKMGRIKDVATELKDISIETGYDFDFLCVAVEELVGDGCTYEQALNQVRDISYEHDW